LGYAFGQTRHAGTINDTGTNNLILSYTPSYGGTLGFSNTILGKNPMLGSLANYGGPTDTRPLLAGSPCIDAGSNAVIPAGLNTDQRGFFRIKNGIVDIGAYESGSILSTSTGNDPGVFFTDGNNQLWLFTKGKFTNTGAFATTFSAGVDILGNPE